MRRLPGIDHRLGRGEVRWIDIVNIFFHNRLPLAHIARRNRVNAIGRTKLRALKEALFEDRVGYSPGSQFIAMLFGYIAVHGENKPAHLHTMIREGRFQRPPESSRSRGYRRCRNFAPLPNSRPDPLRGRLR